MLFLRKLTHGLLWMVLLQCFVLLAFSTIAVAKERHPVSFNVADTLLPNYDDSLHFPITDRRGDFISDTSQNPYDLKMPSNIIDSVQYDPKTHMYTVYEKIGDKYYRTPTTYTYDEYWAIMNRQADMNYFAKRSNTMDLLNRGLVQPKLSIYDNLFNRLFGNGKISIVPQGFVDVTAGYQGQNIANPTLPQNARNSGGLDFNMNAQVNVNANIGGKLKFPINYNTLANFGQDNQLKLDYTGIDDEIVKRFEAGNVQFTTRSTLIPGSQQLFGIKTQLQFGKLNVTAVLASQKSQRQTVNLQGGNAAQIIDLKADAYEENRHFLLAQYFKNNYNKVMQNLPVITTPIQILRLEVWVTNQIGAVTNARTVVGLADIGESGNLNNTSGTVHVLNNSALPNNGSNDEYSQIINNPQSRNPSEVVAVMQSLGLNPVQDYEKTYARLLDSTQYYFNRQVGFISLSQPLQPSQVLGVAYQYSYNGKIYQVGEFSTDVPPDTTTGAIPQVLFLKLLKATAQRPDLPIWHLMMRNVYSVGYGTLSPTGFRLNIMYQQPSFGTKPYVPFGDKNQGTPLLTLLDLDRLNNQLDPIPDGQFDYVEGFTVISRYSRIIFPVLEPFGRDLASKIYNTVPPNAGDSLFYMLYDSLKAVAQQHPNLNRFELLGSASTSGSSDISIGYNIPRGSVTVTAGGQTLIEGTDYDINYDLGTIKIINQAILNAGLPVQVNFENNASFGIQQRNYMGLRLDYTLINKSKEQLLLGGTIAHLGERPFFTKVNYGEDPINNTMYGLDLTYKNDVPRITKLLNKIGSFQSTAPSTINAYAEGAFLKPGHASQIGNGTAGAVYLDDFEGSQASIDLRFPAISWSLASTPLGATDSSGNILFPEAALNDDLDYGKNRAKLAWYQIDPSLQQYQSSSNPLGGNANALSDPRVRLIQQQELFPQQTTDLGQSQLVTFDLAYYPTERGPYNYDSKNINNDNTLKNPQQRWGGLMRSLNQTDFETANVEYIEFWMQDPFIVDSTSNGGQLYFNLGDVSEDILKDGKRQYENGLSTPSAPTLSDSSSVWGIVPLNPVQITNSFSNNPGDRPYQDVGLDGMNDTLEARKRAADYLIPLQSAVNSSAFQAALKDPSADDYMYYEDPSFTSNDGILTRYKNYNNPEGNSPINTGTTYTSAATLYPDAEDLDKDNNLNQTEQYFQYMVNIRPSTDPEMKIGNNYIIDTEEVTPGVQPNGTQKKEIWYHFRIPIDAYQKAIGGIPDFTSIRFMRMFLTGFSDTNVVVLRFGELQFTRNTWRPFQYVLDTTGNYNSILSNNVNFNVGAVSTQQDYSRYPLPYRTPSAIQQQQIQSADGVNLVLNEQSMTLEFCNLGQGDARAVFTTFGTKDLRQYGNMQMYIHAETDPNQPALQDKDLTAVIRIGPDFVSNYYEVRIPLYMTPLSVNTGGVAYFNTNAYNDTLWRAINSLNLDLTVFPKMKEARNNANIPSTQRYSQVQPNGQTYSILGDPNLGQVDGILIGVENTNAASACGQIWVDELRLSDINEKGGWAGVGKADMTLSDLGRVTTSVSHHSVGFGTLEQNTNERFKDDLTQFDIATNLEMGKLLPKKDALSIPVYASYSQSVSLPEYDPYNLDIKLQDELNGASAAKRDSIKNVAVDFSSTTTVNFTNVHKNKTTKGPAKIYDISNFNVSYSYVNQEAHNPLLQNNQQINQRTGLVYSYTAPPSYIEPFKKLKLFKKVKSHWLDLFKDFNFNPIPSQLSFKADLNKQFVVTQVRSIGVTKYAIPANYGSFFTFERDYILRWALSRSFNFDLTANNNSRIDEPYGPIDTKEKKDTVWNNLFKGGRNTLYNQSTNFSYTLPTSKFPLIDWTTINLKYQATYNWTGASLLANTDSLGNLGNILQNGEQKQATLQLDFNKLYNKSKFFKAIDIPQNQPLNNPRTFTMLTDTVFRYTIKNGHTIKTVKQLKLKKVWDPRGMPQVGTAGRIFGKLISSIKQVSIAYAENANTRLPGYLDSTQFVGQDWRSMNPGLGFILGQQPDTTWLNNAAAKGLISKDSNLNDIFQQSYNQNITLSAQIQPVKNFHINLSFNTTFNKNYSEQFKDTTGTGDHFGHLTPTAGGSFNMSYTALKTFFAPFNPNGISQAYLNFENYRQIISQRLGLKNPYSSAQGIGTDGYYYGYGRYSTDVLIPAFIAAYSGGKGPWTVPLINQSNPNIKSNPMEAYLDHKFLGIPIRIPKPNWKFDYSGLSHIKGFDKIFSNFSISDGYTGSLSMNAFNSDLLYADVNRYGYPSFYDTVSKNFVPYFLVPNITIQESFAPLLGMDMTFKNQMQFKFEYAKQRILSLSLVDFQVSETHSSQITIGGGYRKKGLKLPGFIKLPKILSADGTSKLDNEIDFRFDLKITDNVTVNNQLDQLAVFPTSGSRQITLSPTINYTLSKKVNLKLYYNRNKIIPYVSSTPPITNTQAGIDIRISLAP
jgi:cell surface protein SprA